MPDWLTAAIVALCLFALYNANGREIGSIDSQPAKYTATELLRRGTLSLNHVVGARPALAERPTFVRDASGRYWSAYPPTPAIAAAVIAWPVVKAGVIDLADPAAPELIATFASSIVTAFAVAMIFLTARRVLPLSTALLVALGAGAGTGLWPTASRTLWQHECAIAGLSIAVYALAGATLTRRAAAAAGRGLALATTSRLQLAPAAGMLLLAISARAGLRRAGIAAAPLVVAMATLAVFNVSVFGHVLGGLAELEAMHPLLHARAASFTPDAAGFAGLLLSPSRGILVYSPIVAIAAFGWSAPDASWRSLCRWCAAAAACEFALYGSYSVWWGGHTYGPRYMLDVLPLLVPMAVEGVRRIRWRSLAAAASAAALAWSIAVSARGAFVYPNDQWNIDPADVDRAHARLWEWHDSQIARAWRSRPSPRNFMLFDALAGRAGRNAPLSVRSRPPSAPPRR